MVKKNVKKELHKAKVKKAKNIDGRVAKRKAAKLAGKRGVQASVRDSIKTGDPELDKTLQDLSEHAEIDALSEAEELEVGEDSTPEPSDDFDDSVSDDLESDLDGIDEDE